MIPDLILSSLSSFKRPISCEIFILELNFVTVRVFSYALDTWDYLVTGKLIKNNKTEL